MKKLLLAFAILGFVACGEGEKTEAAADTTAPAVDTTAAPAVDTTAPAADTTAAPAADTSAK